MSAETDQEKLARLEADLKQKEETHKELQQQRQWAESRDPANLPPSEAEDQRKWINKTHEEEQRALAEKIRAERTLQEEQNRQKQKQQEYDQVYIQDRTAKPQKLEETAGEQKKASESESHSVGRTKSM